MERFPAHEEVAGGLAFEDAFKLLLKIERVRETGVGSGNAFALADPLSLDPVVQVGVGERLKGAPALRRPVPRAGDS